MESLKKTRRRELAGFDSSITRKSRFVPPWLKISFKNKPTMLNDSPGPLDLRHPGSVELHLYRNWLSEQLPHLRSLPLVGDKQIDNHHASLIRRCEAEIMRVNQLEPTAWYEAMVHSGLLHGITQILEPAKVPTGKSLVQGLRTSYLIHLQCKSYRTRCPTFSWPVCSWLHSFTHSPPSHLCRPSSSSPLSESSSSAS